MDGSCAICFKTQTSTNNRIIRCGNCGVFVHQGCYGILKLPNFVKFADNQSMDLILTESVPSERFNKSCVFCERNQQNAMSTYGVCLQCSWRTCKANFHVTCAAQAGLLVLPPVSEYDPQSTIAMLLKGTPSDSASPNCDSKEATHSASLLAFCSNAHMTKHTQLCPLPPRTTVRSEASSNATAVMLQPSAASNHSENGGAPRPTSKGPCSTSLSPVPHLTATCSPTTYSEAVPANAAEVTELPLSTPTTGSAPAIASSPSLHSKSHVPSNSPSTLDAGPQVWHPMTSPVNGSGVVQADTVCAIKAESKLQEQVTLTPETSPSNSEVGCRRVPRRNAALLANKEFMAARKHRKELEEAKCGSASTATVHTATMPTGVRSRLSHTMPVSRKLTISATKKAKLAARVRRHKGGRKALSSKPHPICMSSTPQSNNCTLKSAVSSNCHTVPPKIDPFLPATRDPFWSTSLRLVPPPLPLSVRDLGLTSSSFQGAGNVCTAEIGNTPNSTMQYLLEWQWDQGGTLLMQQAENTDVVTLLNCLHQLKAENDTLEAKLLRLQSKREHLKSVNARLSASLTTLEGMTHAEYGTAWNPDVHVPPVLAIPSVLSSAVPASSKRPGSPLTHLDPLKKTSSPAQTPRVAALTSAATTICSSYRPLFPAVCTAQRSPSEDLRDLCPFGKTKVSHSGMDSKQKHNTNGGSNNSVTLNENNLIPSLLQRAVGGGNPPLSETSLQPGVRSTLAPGCRPSVPLTSSATPSRRNSESLTALLQPQARISEALQQTRPTSNILPRLQPRVPAKNSSTCPASAPSPASPKETRCNLLSDCSVANSCRLLIGQPVTTALTRASVTVPSVAFLPPVITASANACPPAYSVSSLIRNSTLVPTPSAAAITPEETTAGANLTPLLVSSLERVALSSSSCVSLHSVTSSSSSSPTASVSTSATPSSSSSSLLLNLNLPSTATIGGQNLQLTRSSACPLGSYAGGPEELATRSDRPSDPVAIAANSSTATLVVVSSSLDHNAVAIPVSSDFMGSTLLK
ncbi:Protein AF-17 [Sparganum proliferum]